MIARETISNMLPFLLLASVASAQLLVLNKAANELVFVDPNSNQIAGRVPVGDGPHEIVVSPDGRHAFVSNYGAQTPGQSISMIDIRGMKELRRIDLGPLRRPHGLWFADGRVYFTAEMNRLIGRYDPTSDKVDWLFGTGLTGTHMVSLTRDGRIITANIGSDSMTVIEKNNATVIPVGKSPEGNSLTPDQKQLWVANGGSGNISVIDLDSKRVIETIDIQTKRSNRLQFTPDGKLVFVSDLSGDEVVVLNAETHKQVKRLPVGRTPEGILVQPDGSRIYVALAGDNAVAVIDPKTLEVLKRIPTGSGPDGLAWVSR